ncbi:amino acid ABC transporter permease [Falsirhodobacter sp. 20TX0035]|uniref:amino acid ABC transporter permease n=1 Tax=Falsirhodobacter sp. 20TX0035 TaxID=3022019 RepID=UPI00232D3A09|nr:amino acid ABC transporter permease [Falsirhodobacter sp. 20TX0035]MDB6454231.1 amino acid ABC transporter permease [Falsirhodobacter sp. 20TX0035]
MDYIAARPAPAKSPAPILRILFGDAVAALITVGVIGLIVLMLPVLEWAVFDAVWHGDAAACRAGGACWAYIHDKARLILFGIYPPDQQWRPVIVIGLILAMVMASLSPRFWNARLALLWGGAILVMLVLMKGGVFGMADVPTAKWGGLPVTLLLAVLSLGMGFPLAVLLALGRQSKLPVVKAVSVCVIELVRGLPLIGLLFVAAILLPLLLPSDWTIDKLGRTVAALTVFAAAYLAEVLRGGLQGLGKGQAEAAQALGISYWKMIWHIVLPQAIQKVIPPLTNTAIVMVKNTSLVMIVGVFDMLGAGRAAAGDPAWPAPFTETYLFVAAVYFAICFGISIYARWLERGVKRKSHA